MQRKVQAVRRVVYEGFLRLVAITCRNRVLLYGVVTLPVDLLSFLLCYLSFGDDCSEAGIVISFPSLIQSFSVADYFRCNVRDDSAVNSPNVAHSDDG